jgi:predicted MFS family arabinose efflux permease
MDTATARTARSTRGLLAATGAGAVFEWYDFYLCIILVPYLPKIFFPVEYETASFLTAFTAYAIGFIVRPFGALLFGRLGDTIGRKHTFMMTIVFMGFATFTIGLLPTFAQIGWVSPAMLVALRIVQGLAIGGEYAGAAVYMAEFVPASRRGLTTGWIQITPTLGLVLAIAAFIVIRGKLPESEFLEWGWRVPFLGSLVLLMLTMLLRAGLPETPVFQWLRSTRAVSPEPMRELFLPGNMKAVLLCLLGVTAGQGAVVYVGQAYVLFFLTNTLQLDLDTASKFAMANALTSFLMIPFLAWLSDKTGRLRIILAGFLFAAIAVVPAFVMLSQAVNRDLVAFRAESPVTVTADQEKCGMHLFAGPWSKITLCDQVRGMLANYGLSFAFEHSPGTRTVTVSIGNHSAEITGGNEAGVRASVEKALFAAGYPGIAWKYVDGEPQTAENGDPLLERTGADHEKVDYVTATFAFQLIVLMAALVYGPSAAFLSEYFHPRLRYLSVSLVYHIGTGWLGGLVPVIATTMVLATGNTYAGLWYVIAVALFSLAISLLLVGGRKSRQIHL